MSRSFFTTPGPPRRGEGERHGAVPDTPSPPPHWRRSEPSPPGPTRIRVPPPSAVTLPSPPPAVKGREGEVRCGRAVSAHAPPPRRPLGNVVECRRRRAPPFSPRAAGSAHARARPAPSPPPPYVTAPSAATGIPGSVVTAAPVRIGRRSCGAGREGRGDWPGRVSAAVGMMDAAAR